MSRKRSGKGQSPRLHKRSLSPLGEFVVARLKRQGVEKRELAERHRISPQNLSAMLRSHDPKLSTIRKLAAMLGVTPAKLLGDVDRIAKRRGEIKRSRPPSV